jgi:hypothetical protein
MRHPGLFCAALFLPVAATAAPCPAPGSAYRFLRFDESWAHLRDPTCQADIWDGAKLMVLEPDATRFLTLGGDARLKLINTRDVVLGEDLGRNENVAAQRYHAHANWRAASWLRVFAEFKFNDVSGREPRPGPVDVDRGDTHQLFADIAAGTTNVRLGRQELLYGAGRRIFPRNGSNVRGSFDAARVTTSLGAWRADALVFRPVEVDPGSFDDSSIDSQTIGGIYATNTAAFGPMGVDLYWLASRRDGIRFDQGAGNDHRHSFGARFAGIRGSWDADLEATYQTGTFGSGSVKAWALTGDLGYRTPGEYPVRWALRMSAASGDRDPAQASMESFYSLFPQGGTLDDYFSVSTANLLFARATADVALGRTVKLIVETAWMGRTSVRDGIYGAGGALQRPAGASRSRAVGVDVGAQLRWSATPRFGISLVAGMMEPGDFLRDTGATRRMYVFNTFAAYRF